jgi:glycosyltransferase involved in cell wall biosynthesis
MSNRISVLIIGYRRPDHLARTIAALREQTVREEVELVVADDGSPPEMQRLMRTFDADRFAMSPKNSGLGSNSNAGLAATTGDPVLQIQDDWHCSGPKDFLQVAASVLRARPDIGLIRLTQPFAHLPSHDEEIAGRRVRILHHEAGSAEFIYSDNPHLKSRAFIEFIGPYKESRHMQLTEFDMRDRFNAQTRFKAAFIEGLAPFEHTGADVSFNRPLPLARVGMFMDKVPGLHLAARLYRAAKRLRSKR